MQVLQQPLGLLPFAGRLFAILTQLGAFGVQDILDTLLDRPLALTQAVVLRPLVAVVGQRGLQFGAQLPHLGHQRGDRIVRRVAFDAERPHLVRRQLAAGIAGER